VFNIQPTEQYVHSVVRDIAIRDTKYLNPELLMKDKEKILSEENRINYLNFMANHTWTIQEIQSGYAFKCLYKTLLTQIKK
jgi:hypothetical protein